MLLERQIHSHVHISGELFLYCKPDPQPTSHTPIDPHQSLFFTSFHMLASIDTHLLRRKNPIRALTSLNFGLTRYHQYFTPDKKHHKKDKSETSETQLAHYIEDNDRAVKSHKQNKT